MQFLAYAFLVASGVYALAFLILMILSGKPLKFLFLNALLGTAAFILVGLVSRFTGVRIPLNEYTASATAALGIPGVCGVLMLRLIFGV